MLILTAHLLFSDLFFYFAGPPHCSTGRQLSCRTGKVGKIGRKNLKNSRDTNDHVKPRDASRGFIPVIQQFSCWAFQVMAAPRSIKSYSVKVWLGKRSIRTPQQRGCVARFNADRWDWHGSVGIYKQRR